MNTEDEKHMRRALGLARHGLGKVEPNPAVGALLVKAGEVIGKGWHRKFGGPHAEVDALHNCAARGLNPQGATLYVTLEPCCHQGKTGPCTDALIKAGIAKAVVATQDPAGHAHGAGIAQLRQAGIQVEVGCRQPEARLLNAPFFQFARSGKPWVVLKWAQSLDCHLARKIIDQADDVWISNPQSRRDVHRLRRRTQAILVGINTVIHDNPRLTPRPSKGRMPLRIVLDNRLRIPMTCRLLRSAAKHPTLVVTTQATFSGMQARVEAIRGKGAEVLACPNTAHSTDLNFVLTHLSQRGIQQLLVEGGPTIHAAFLQAGLMDETCIYLAPQFLGSQGTATLPLTLCTQEIHPCVLQNITVKSMGQDIRWVGLNTRSVDEILAW
jgi:diaminohydroxyphosphoribosylaminopyrimidine deaminase/5-amino-6-(5-phosphoribosylamino)uracil reductase